MVDLPVPYENRLPADLAVSQLKQTLQKIRPSLIDEGKGCPKGFQLLIQGPDVEVSSAEGYRKITGRNLDGLGEILLGLKMGQLYAPQHLGLVNVIGATTDRLSMEFRSQTGGRNFEIVFDGNSVTINGEATAEEVNEALSLLFTNNGQINRDEKTIHTLTTRNLEFYDRDGSRIQDKNKLPTDKSSARLVSKTSK